MSCTKAYVQCSTKAHVLGKSRRKVPGGLTVLRLLGSAEANDGRQQAYYWAEAEAAAQGSGRRAVPRQSKDVQCCTLYSLESTLLRAE